MRRLLALAALAVAAHACSPEAPAGGGAAAPALDVAGAVAQPLHEPGDRGHGLGPPVTVMTRNLYLGADIARITTAKTPQEIPLVAGALWATAQMTDFPARARLVADEIEEARPDLIALEEVSLFRTGPGASCQGLNVPATTVAIDFLQILQGELAARHLHYDLAAVVENFDGQLCAFDGQGFLDVRLTDRDAILARQGLQTRNPRSGHFAAVSALPAGGGSIPVLRGWNSVEARVRGQWLQFTMTHLETEADPPTQAAQAAELATLVKAGIQPAIVAGDFNAGPELAGVTTSYADLLAAGLQDPWPRLRGDRPGPTCCFDELLLTGTLETRIDLTLYQGQLRPVWIGRVGLGDRTPAGLHASDHAGVVTVFRVGAERRGRHVDRD